MALELERIHGLYIKVLDALFGHAVQYVSTTRIGSQCTHQECDFCDGLKGKRASTLG